VRGEKVLLDGDLARIYGVKLQINSGNGLRPVSNSSVELEVGCPG